jgi:hypothetical protein
MTKKYIENYITELNGEEITILFTVDKGCSATYLQPEEPLSIDIVEVQIASGEITQKELESLEQEIMENFDFGQDWNEE